MELNYTYKREVLNAISISTINDEVIIKANDADVFELDLSELNDASKYKVTHKEGKLSVSRKKTLTDNWFKDDKKGRIYLYIPSKHAIKEISLKTINGDLGLDSLYIPYVKFDTINGEVAANEIICDAFKSRTINASLKVASGTIGDASVSSISGNIEILATLSKGSFNTISGTITLLEPSDHIKTVTLSGKVYYRNKP